MEEIKEGEIVYANMTIHDANNKSYDLRKIVFSREWKSQYPLLQKSVYSRFLKQHNIDTDATVVNVVILARTGFKHKDKGYSTAKKNEQVRDDVTGAYV